MRIKTNCIDTDRRMFLKYITIYQQLKEDIQQEVYSDGQKLPSIRLLAKIHQCSIETIKHALQLLVENELIYAKNRSGFYVLQKEKESIAMEESTLIDFGSSTADGIAFPYQDFQLCLKKATENYKQDFFKYGNSQGLPELIHTLQDWFKSQQIYTKSENIFITTGVQQALFILSRLNFPNNKQTILVETPSYHLMLAILQTENMPFLTIKRQDKQFDWELLEYYFKEKDIKFFYVTPRISNPLGLSYTESEKKRLVALAQQYNVYLIEDDYLADFVDNPTNQPLHFYDTNERVIYLKSFSKIMFPGLRIGACLLPDKLTASFQQYRSILEIDSGMFSQAGLNLYIKTGMFDHHVEQTKKHQRERNETFLKAIIKYDREHLFQPNIFQTYKTFIELPHNVSKSMFEKELELHNVNLDNMSRHFTNQDNLKNTLYGLELFNLTPNQITKGVQKITNAHLSSIKKD